MVNRRTAHHLQTGTTAQDARVHTTGTSFRAAAFVIMRYGGAAEYLSARTATQKTQVYGTADARTAVGIAATIMIYVARSWAGTTAGGAVFVNVLVLVITSAAAPDSGT